MPTFSVARAARPALVAIVTSRPTPSWSSTWNGSSGKMPQAVREALIEGFQEHGGMSRGDAEAYLVGLEKGGRYRQETW